MLKKKKKKKEQIIRTTNSKRLHSNAVMTYHAASNIPLANVRHKCKVQTNMKCQLRNQERYFKG